MEKTSPHFKFIPFKITPSHDHNEVSGGSVENAHIVPNSPPMANESNIGHIGGSDRVEAFGSTDKVLSARGSSSVTRESSKQSVTFTTDAIIRQKSNVTMTRSFKSNGSYDDDDDEDDNVNFSDGGSNLDADQDELQVPSNTTDAASSHGGDEADGSPPARLKRDPSVARPPQNDKIRKSRMAQESLEKSGFRKFFANDGDHHVDEFDHGVNAMGMICALVLSIPFQMMSSMDSTFLQELQAVLVLCPNSEAVGGWGYRDIFNYFKATIISCVFTAITGIIFSTFYFLFKRTSKEHYTPWRKKARILVLCIFISTSFSLISLMMFTLFILNYYFVNMTDVCMYNIDDYVIPFFSLASMAFVASIYLVY